MTVEITLNNAQGGGPQLIITNDNIIMKKVWLRATRSDDKGVYFSEGEAWKSLKEFSKRDGIVIYSEDPTQ